MGLGVVGGDVVVVTMGRREWGARLMFFGETLVQAHRQDVAQYATLRARLVSRVRKDFSGRTLSNPFRREHLLEPGLEPDAFRDR